jgi:hypothetical protein
MAAVQRRLSYDELAAVQFELQEDDFGDGPARRLAIRLDENRITSSCSSAPLPPDRLRYCRPMIYGSDLARHG